MVAELWGMREIKRSDIMVRREVKWEIGKWKGGLVRIKGYDQMRAHTHTDIYIYIYIYSKN